MTLVVEATTNNAPPPGFFIGFAALWVGIAVLSLGSLAFAIVCIVDIVRRPDWQWKLAGQEKVVWLLLVILINFLCLPAVMSFVYWFAIRPKLTVVEKAAQAGHYGPGFWTPGGWVPGPALPVGASVPAGWFPDPSGQARQRYWDGQRWTDHLDPGSPGPTAS